MSQSRPTIIEATRYAENYIIYGVKTDAFLVAFPNCKARRNGVSNTASNFHKLEAVQKRIKELQAVAKRVSEEEFNLSVSDVLKLLATVTKKGLRDKNGKAENLNAVVSSLSEVSKINGYHAAKEIDLKTPLTLVPTLTQEQALELLKKNGIE